MTFFTPLEFKNQLTVIHKSFQIFNLSFYTKYTFNNATYNEQGISL